MMCLISLTVVVSCKDNDTDTSSVNQVELINQNDIERVEPPNWWVGFKSDSLQLLVKHKNIADYKPNIPYSGIKIKTISKGNNSNNYLFIDLDISKAEAGKFNIIFISISLKLK